MDFHVDGIPEALPIRDRSNGQVVDGYRLTVVSNVTGARAVLELPKRDMTPENVAREATRELGKLDSTLAAFPRPDQ